MMDKFSEEELTPYIGTIKEEIEKFDKEVAAVGKQETWTKVIVHKVDLERFPDNENGMKSLHTELETFNEGLALASTRYIADCLGTRCPVSMMTYMYCG